MPPRWTLMPPPPALTPADVPPTLAATDTLPPPALAPAEMLPTLALAETLLEPTPTETPTPLEDEELSAPDDDEVAEDEAATGSPFEFTTVGNLPSPLTTIAPPVLTTSTTADWPTASRT